MIARASHFFARRSVVVVALVAGAAGYAVPVHAVDVDAGAAVVDDDSAADASAAHAADLAAPPMAQPVPPVPLDEPLVTAPTTGEMILPFIKTMVMLGVVLLLVWLTLAKGMGKLVERAQAGKRVRVVERIALDARRSLYLVDIDGRHVLIGGGDVAFLGDVAAKPSASTTAPAAVPSGFLQLLKKPASPTSASASAAAGAPAAAATPTSTSTETA